MTVSDTPHSELFERLARVVADQYQLVREQGRGGMGVVFLATDTALDREVAIKVIHPELAAHESLVRRFLAEARTIAKLRHPNIVAVHAAGTGDGLLYYVMDLVPGETLRARLRREGRLPPAEVAKLVDDLAAALQAAAEAGIVHRDVKPENVLLDRDGGRAMLADFGIARVLQQAEGAVVTAGGVAVGTPTYMSPEQAAGEDVDARSDLYALGIVAYEMLTGKPPFTGPNRVIVSRHIAERPAPIRVAAAETPPHLAAAIEHALEKDPDHRWQSGDEFRRAVGGALPVPRRRRTRWMAVAAAALLAVSAFVAVSITGSDAPPDGVNPRRSLLVLPFDNIRGDSATAWLSQGSMYGLNTVLSQWEDLQVVDAERVHDIMAGERLSVGDDIGLNRARSMARKAGVWTVALGTFEQVGDSLRLTARLYDVATGRHLETAQVSGPASGDPLPLFDGLAFQLLDLSGAPADLRTSLAQSTTSSLDAFRSFVRGSDALSHWDLTTAERALREATERDSTFGLAYYKYALTRGWLVGAEDSLSDDAMARAVAFSVPLPLHERTLIAAYRAFLEGQFAASRELYGQLIRRDSADVDAWYGMGESWFHDPDVASGHATAMSEALRAFRHTLNLDPDYVLAYEHIGQMLAGAGRPGASFVLMPDESFVLAQRPAPGAPIPARVESASRRAQQAAVDLAVNWVATQPTAPRAHGALVDSYIASGRYGDAMSEVQRFRAVGGDQPERPFVEARVHFAAGRVDEAAEILSAALDSTSPEDFRARDGTPSIFGDIASAANVFAYQGSLEQAARTLDLADRVRNEVYPYLGPGLGVGDHWGRSALSQLYAAAGVPTASLRQIWERTAEEARVVPKAKRAPIIGSGASAAIGLFAGLESDTNAIVELAALSEEPLPPEVRALLAMAGPQASAKDSLAARRALAEADSAPSKMMMYHPFKRPLAAQAYAALGDYAAALAMLDGFEPEMQPGRRFDARWAMLGRVRLYRANLLERQGQKAKARTEYERVLAQWSHADESVQPYVREARARLAALEPERS